jgi:dTDP-4-amino-4,6-dideoxygalactose transaminase
MVRPCLNDTEAEAVARVIRSGWVAQGPEVAAFETEFAAAVQAPQAVAVCNCTSALELCLRVLGIGPGDDVVTVSHSFIATANSAVAVGARPVFVDINPATYGMDPTLIEAALTPKTRAIVVAHQLGFPCELAPLIDLATRKTIPVIEDAACAIGSEIEWNGRWQRIGKPHGLLACFSFHPRKIITTGDGGMITTAEKALADRLRRLRQHGMALGSTIRQTSKRVLFESFVEPAYNCRMTDLQAAIGRTQLARLDEFVATRRSLAQRYHASLKAHPWLIPFAEPSWMRANYQSYPLAIQPQSPLGQTAIIQHMLDCQVACQRGVGNAHSEPAYRLAPWSCGPKPCDESLHAAGQCRRLGHSETARDRTILVPLFQGISDAEQQQVLAALQALV